MDMDEIVKTLNEHEDRLKKIEECIKTPKKDVNVDKESSDIWVVPPELKGLIEMTPEGPIINSIHVASLKPKEAFGVFLLCSREKINEPSKLDERSRRSGIPIANARMTLKRDMRGLVIPYERGLWKLSNPKWVIEEVIPKLRGGK